MTVYRSSTQFCPLTALGKLGQVVCFRRTEGRVAFTTCYVIIYLFSSFPYTREPHKVAKRVTMFRAHEQIGQGFRTRVAPTNLRFFFTNTEKFTKIKTGPVIA